MRKRLCTTGLLITLLCLMAAALAGCGQSPPQSFVKDMDEGAPAIPAQPDAGEARRFTALLYFRYGDTGMLCAQERELTVAPNETRDKAIVRALLQGPGAAGAHLTAVFQPDVEVLSTQAQGDTVYVTFSEALYGRYAGEPSSLSGAKVRYAAALRRRLAMAALTASLTESGAYARVQVLVRPETRMDASMRLKRSYFLEESELPAEPLWREEKYLLTPANAAGQILSAWRARDWETLKLYVLSDGRGQATDYAASAAIGAYAVSGGSVSPDGQSAVVCLDFTPLDEGGAAGARAVTALPLRLTLDKGVWKATQYDVKRLMGLEE